MNTFGFDLPYGTWQDGEPPSQHASHLTRTALIAAFDFTGGVNKFCPRQIIDVRIPDLEVEVKLEVES